MVEWRGTHLVDVVLVVSLDRQYCPVRACGDRGARALMDSPALVLDFGGPVLLTPFELAADQPGTPAFELLRERGPLAPRDSPDSGWEAVQDGQVTERDYWSGVAKIWHQTGGAGPDVRSFMDHLFQPPRPGL